MPLFDYLCLDCGKVSEVLMTSSQYEPKCDACGSSNVKKLLSAHSTFSGGTSSGLPGVGDTACCGSTPSHAGCAGPGSCCGKFQG